MYFSKNEREVLFTTATCGAASDFFLAISVIKARKYNDKGERIKAKGEREKDKGERTKVKLCGSWAARFWDRHIYRDRVIIGLTLSLSFRCSFA